MEDDLNTVGCTTVYLAANIKLAAFIKLAATQVCIKLLLDGLPVLLCSTELGRRARNACVQCSKVHEV